MKHLIIAALVAGLSSGALAQTAGGGAAGGATTGGGTSTPGGAVTPGLPQQNAPAVSNPTADGQIPGGVPATPPPGGIHQPVTVGTPAGQNGVTVGTPAGNVLPQSALNSPATNSALGRSFATNTLGAPNLPGAVGGLNNAGGIPGTALQLTPTQSQQIDLLAMQLNALRGATTDPNQSIVTVETGLRQLTGNPQLGAGTLTPLATGLVNAWQNANLTATQQQQILSAVTAVLSTQGDPATAQQMLVAAQTQLRAAGLPNTTVAALRNQLQQILVAQRTQQTPGGPLDRDAAGRPAGRTLGTGAAERPAR